MLQSNLKLISVNEGDFFEPGKKDYRVKFRRNNLFDTVTVSYENGVLTVPDIKKYRDVLIMAGLDMCKAYQSDSFPRYYWFATIEQYNSFMTGETIKDCSLYGNYVFFMMDDKGLLLPSDLICFDPSVKVLVWLSPVDEELKLKRTLNDYVLCPGRKITLNQYLVPEFNNKLFKAEAIRTSADSDWLNLESVNEDGT